MKLYYYPGACSLSSHIILQELELKFDLIKVDFASKKTEYGENYGQINQALKVPALEIDDGKILTQANAINLYLAERFPEANLLPQGDIYSKAKLYEILNFLASDLHKSFSPLFSIESDIAVAKYVKLNIKHNMDILETQLFNNKCFLVGDRFSIADAYLFVMLRWVNFLGFQILDWPNLANFLNFHSTRPSIIRAISAEN